jgi:DNA replication terminus site-binding protein
VDNITKLKVDYNDINDRLTLVFNMIYEDATSMTADVFELPPPTNEDVGKSPESISVLHHRDHVAKMMARQHYFKHTLNAERSGRVLPRLPGVVFVEHPHALDCMQRLADINQRKDAFQHFLKSSIPGDKNERFRTVSHALPDLVKLQLSRHVLFLDCRAKTIGFSWANRHSIKRLSKEDVLSMLAITDNYYKERQPLSDFIDIVAKEISYIDSFSQHTQFVIRRPLRIAPMMNVSFQLPKVSAIATHKNASNIVAHSPILVFNQQPKIRGLKNYVKKNNVNDSGAHTTKLVIPRLHLYEVLPK